LYNNLLKQGYGFVLHGTEEKRVIDTNDLVARRLEELKKVVNRQGMTQDDGFTEGFVQGIEAEDVSALLNAGDEGGAVLKAESAQEKAQSILEEANTQAQATLEGAKVQAEQILQDARGQAENMKHAAMEEGRLSGYRTGKEKADAEAEELRRQMKAKEAQLEAQYQSALDQMESQLVEAITGIYEHVFHVELCSYRDILVHLIASTLRKAEGSKDFLVHVSKEDYSYVSMQRKQLQAGLPGNGVTLEIIEDMTVEKDGCMIETEGGIFDCGLGTQLEQLRRKLMLLSYTG
jgi:Flagellar biosynthesis/type III secretory pathway protein